MKFQLGVLISVGIAVTLILFMTYHLSDSTSLEVQKYDDGLINDLLPREFDIDFVIYDEKPEHLCFILEEQKGEFYRDLKAALQNADISYWSAPDKNEREWVHMDVSIYPTKKQGLELINQHDFEHSKKKSQSYNIKNLDDYYHEFLCNFEYDKKYYQMQIYFSNIYPSWDNFTFVNFTRIDGNPVVLNQDIEVFHGGFNSTVIFYNQLEKPVTLSFDQKQMDGKDIFGEFDVIPPNKQWPHSFSYDNNDPKKIRYVTNPYDLSGTVTFKSHPNCMGMDYATSLYSQTGLEPTFPTYLPEGYIHRCSGESSVFALVSVYSKDEMSSYRPFWNEEEQYRQGGLLIMNNQRMYDAEWNAREDIPKRECDYLKGGTVLEINLKGKSDPVNAIFLKDDYDMDGVNTLVLCEGNYSFLIRGMFSQDELVKIAESME